MKFSTFLILPTKLANSQSFKLQSVLERIHLASLIVVTTLLVFIETVHNFQKKGTWN